MSSLVSKNLHRVVFGVASNTDFPDDVTLSDAKITFMVRVVTGAATVARRKFSFPASLFSAADRALRIPRADVAVSSMLRDTPIPFPIPLDRMFFFEPSLIYQPEIHINPPQNIVKMITFFVAGVVNNNKNSTNPRKLLRIGINIQTKLYLIPRKDATAFQHSLFFNNIALSAKKLIEDPPHQVSMKLFLFIVFFLCWAFVMVAKLG